MPKLCQRWPKKASKEAFRKTLMTVIYIRKRVFPSAVNACPKTKPMAMGNKPIANPERVIATRLTSASENAPRWKRILTISLENTIMKIEMQRVTMAIPQVYKRRVFLKAFISLVDACVAKYGKRARPVAAKRTPMGTPLILRALLIAVIVPLV